MGAVGVTEPLRQHPAVNTEPAALSEQESCWIITAPTKPR